MGGCNREGYPDPTAGIAIGWVMKQEKRKKKEGQSSNSSSSSSSSYDEGSDDAYSGDYDENRYDNDENYRDGVDDMLDELGE